jgi:serine/threonine protein kinase
VVEDVETQKQYVMKSIIIQEQKKADFEGMVKNWKLLRTSKAKDFIVEYVEHFFKGKNTSYYFIHLCLILFYFIVVIMEYCVGGDLESLIKKKVLENTKFTEEV